MCIFLTLSACFLGFCLTIANTQAIGLINQSNDTTSQFTIEEIEAYIDNLYLSGNSRENPNGTQLKINFLEANDSIIQGKIDKKNLPCKILIWSLSKSCISFSTLYILNPLNSKYVKYDLDKGGKYKYLMYNIRLNEIKVFEQKWIINLAQGMKRELSVEAMIKLLYPHSNPLDKRHLHHISFNEKFEMLAVPRKKLSYESSPPAFICIESDYSIISPMYLYEYDMQKRTYVFINGHKKAPQCFNYLPFPDEQGRKEAGLLPALRLGALPDEYTSLHCDDEVKMAYLLDDWAECLIKEERNIISKLNTKMNDSEKRLGMPKIAVSLVQQELREREARIHQIEQLSSMYLSQIIERTISKNRFYR